MQQPEPQGIQRYLRKNLISAEGEMIGTIEEFFYKADGRTRMDGNPRRLPRYPHADHAPLASSSLEADSVHTA